MFLFISVFNVFNFLWLLPWLLFFCLYFLLLLLLLWGCFFPEALLKRRTQPSSPRTPSARSGSLSTSPSDRPPTRNTQGFSMSTKLWEKCTEKQAKKKKKKKRKMLKLFVLYCHGEIWGSIHFNVSQLGLHSHSFAKKNNVNIIHFLLTEVEVKWPSNPITLISFDCLIIDCFTVASFSLSTVTMIIRMFDVLFFTFFNFLTYFAVSRN